MESMNCQQQQLVMITCSPAKKGGEKRKKKVRTRCHLFWQIKTTSLSSLHSEIVTEAAVRKAKEAGKGKSFWACKATLPMTSLPKHTDRPNPTSGEHKGDGCMGLGPVGLRHSIYRYMCANEMTIALKYFMDKVFPALVRTYTYAGQRGREE